MSTSPLDGSFQAEFRQSIAGRKEKMNPIKVSQSRMVIKRPPRLRRTKLHRLGSSFLYCTSVSLITEFDSPAVMFLTQEFCSMVCLALQFVILCYLIKIYRAVLQLGMNHQQLTDAREGNNGERINDRSDIADPPHIRRYPTEHDERED